MSLNPRAIATLGIGFGATPTAYLGLWPVGDLVVPPAPPAAGGGSTLQLGRRRLVRRVVPGPYGPEEVLIPDDWTAADLADLAIVLAMSDVLN